MTKSLPLLFALTALPFVPVSASEVGLLFDKQVGTSVILGPGYLGTMDKQEAVKPSGFGIRGGYTVANLWAAEFSIAATYHPAVKDDFVQDLAPNPPQNFGKFKSEYFSVGAQFDWKLLVNLHAGLDIRREKATAEFTGGSAQGTSFTRPWVSAGIGFSFPTPGVQPFVRLEAAYTLQKNDLPSSGYNFEDILRAMAPKYQIGIYAGVRF